VTYTRDFVLQIADSALTPEIADEFQMAWEQFASIAEKVKG
jgi:hypothetical protein